MQGNISPVSRNGVNVFFIIDEGKRYILNKVKFNGLESIKEKKLMSILGLKENFPYNPVQINTNLMSSEFCKSRSITPLQLDGVILQPFDLQRTTVSL